MSKTRVYECVEDRTVTVGFDDGERRFDIKAGELVRVDLGGACDLGFGGSAAFVARPKRPWQYYLLRWTKVRRLPTQERNNP